MNEAADKLREEIKESAWTVLEERKEWTIFDDQGMKMVRIRRAERDFAIRSLTNAIREVVGSSSTSGNNIYAMAFLAGHYSRIKAYYDDSYDLSDKTSNVPELVELLGFIEVEAVAHKARFEQRLATGKVEFYDLLDYFNEDERVVFGEGDARFAGFIKEVEVKRSWTGTFLQINVEIITNVTGRLAKAIVAAKIPAFGGLAAIDDLPVQKLVDGSPLMEQLIARGRIFAKTISGAAYLHFSGLLERPTYWATNTFRADGRVMVDAATFARVDSNQFNECKRSMFNRTYGDDDEVSLQDELSEDLLFSAAPYVFGFSFRAKRWGQMLVASLSDIQWAEGAYDKLVLPAEEKEMVRALVENSGDSFNDIVDGKGGGCIFMLHGEPGQGKTLTAETVAELLKRPLYSISVGELGTDPDALEERLREILDLASVWNAVLLLDEADIFLEARDERDVLRNAMVGVFLRLLEYHQGVLFLTTNRVRNIDPAFYSRISVALSFGKADDAKRLKIWSNLLGAAKVELAQDEIVRLAKSEINGRQIKNVIRLAQTIAKSRGETVTVDAIAKMIEMTSKFEEGMKKAVPVLGEESRLPKRGTALLSAAA